MSKNQEIIIGFLIALSLLLVGVYATLRLKQAKIFVQQPISCQVNSCSLCDVNQDQVFDSSDAASLKFLWQQAGCQEKIQTNLTWCLKNCSQIVKPTKKYQCTSKVYQDVNCQADSWSFSFTSNSDKTSPCQLNKQTNQYTTTDCQLK